MCVGFLMSFLCRELFVRTFINLTASYIDARFYVPKELRNDKHKGKKNRGS